LPATCPWKSNSCFQTNRPTVCSETLKREQVNLFYAKAPAEFGVIEANPTNTR